MKYKKHFILDNRIGRELTWLKYSRNCYFCEERKNDGFRLCMGENHVVESGNPSSG